MQNWYKNVFVDATVTWDSNQSSSPPKYVSVLRELPNKLAIHENPLIQGWIFVILTFKSISFQISQHINIVLESYHDILQVIVQKLRFINQNSVNLCEKE